METVTINRAVLKFRSTGGDIVRFTIPRARLNKTSESAQASMDAMLNGGAVNVGGLTPASIYGAQLVSTERTRIV